MSRSRETTLAILSITGLGLAARLLVLPFATTDGSDSVSRTWIAWRWLSDPEFITSGVWGPLHFYLIGVVMALVPEPVYAPVALHVIFGIAAPWLVYAFTKEVFSSTRAALLVGGLYALYPVAIRNSVSVRSETIFVVFMLASMLLMAIARSDRGRMLHAGGAGLALTLAAMLRYEGWMLIPLFGVLLWRKPKYMLVFGIVAMIHPVIWIIGNWVEFGDPLYSFNWASNWEQTLMGRSDRDWAWLARQTVAYPYHILRGMNFLLGLLAATGALIALLRRDRGVVWLVPLAGLSTLIMYSILRGTLVPKLNYTLTIGTMLFPFAAVVFERLGIETWGIRRCFASAFALLGTMAAISCVASWEGLRLGPVIERIAVSSVPRIENQAIALSLPQIITKTLGGRDEGLISDFYGWGATHYVELLTRLYPDRIFTAPGAPNQELDIRSLIQFLEEHPNGVMVLLRGSRFAKAIEAITAGQLKVAGRGMALLPVRSVNWPATGVDSKAYSLKIFRYHVESARSVYQALQQDCDRQRQRALAGALAEAN